ncbi:MAG: hypothetical protein HYS17_10455 [Micavibrio aeruginosavorus]|uniref:Uncharacterized protein n=1 Tax=Micavibrio aeruginosavorus TaxID=349221 RepID=A0A7T5R1N8_9BACT|nr:MAG: hypothetical protein HYS17_10455 [Micavibrio aeruginosavorus]
MKINIDRSGDLSALFAMRANPWAPRYEPDLWNDRSEGAFASLIDRHFYFLKRTLKLFDLREGTVGLSQLFNRFDTVDIASKTGVPVDFVSQIRGDVMSFLRSTMYSTNCYAYTLNIRDGHPPGSKLFPGQLAQRHTNPVVPWEGDIDQVVEGAIRDGLRLFDGDPLNDKIPETFYLAALHERPQQGGKQCDYHFLRIDRHGGVSHKNGHGYVTNLDYGGAEIVDPFNDAVLPGYRYHAAFLVPCVMT